MTLTTRDKVTAMLMDAGTWVSRDALSAASTCVPAVDDSLADLVIEGRAEHNPRTGYRLAGSDQVRGAARRLVRTGRRAAVTAQASAQGMRIGVAQQRTGLGLVMYELALPPLAEGEDELQHLQRQVEATLAFVDGLDQGEARDA